MMPLAWENYDFSNAMQTNYEGHDAGSKVLVFSFLVFIETSYATLQLLFVSHFLAYNNYFSSLIFYFKKSKENRNKDIYHTMSCIFIAICRKMQKKGSDFFSSKEFMAGAQVASMCLK